MLEVDKLETRLRKAAGMQPVISERSLNESRSFLADLGCGARVQINHIDGKPVGSIGLDLRRLSPEAAEAVIKFLRQRNEPNSYHSRR